MVCALFALLVIAQPAGFSPVGNPPSVTWGTKSAYLVAQNGVAFELSGPAKVLVSLAGGRDLRNRVVHLDILRNDSHVSKNAIKLRSRRRGPKGYPVGALVGFEVPEGAHLYTLRADAVLVASLEPAKRIAKKVLAEAEIEMPSEETAAASEPAVAASEPAVAASEPAVAASEPAVAASEPAVATRELESDGSEVLVAAALATTADEETTERVTRLLQAKRVAVYDLELSEIQPTIGAVVTDSLVTEIRKLRGISVIGMDEIRDMLSHEANKQFLGCESDESCLAEIAGALGVDDLVTGKLSRVADNHMMLVRRIDQRRAKVAGVYDQRLAAESGQEFLLSVGPAVEQLFPETPLRDGLERGVAEEVALRLDPPPLPPWSFYSVAGASVAAALVGGALGLQAKNAESQFNTQAASAGTISGRDLVNLQNEANDYAFAANVTFAVAGGFAVSAAIMYLFTDWHGYSEAAVNR